jgi:hypothetical protein
MRITISCLAMAAAVGVLAAGKEAQASPVLQFTGGTGFFAGEPLSLGWSFTPNSAITVLALDEQVNN